MYVLSGEAITIPVRFRVGGNLVVPDTDSVKGTIRDQAGSIVSGWDHKTLDNGGLNTMNVPILGTVNTASVREKRSLIVDYAYKGAGYKAIIHYFVTPWLNLTLSPQDVRDFFGANESELPDNLASPEAGYYRAIDLYSSSKKSQLDAALIDPDLMQAANNIVLGLACFAVLEIMKVRIMKQELSDQESYARFDSLDMIADFQPKIAGLVASAADAVFNRAAATPTLFDVSVGTDVITGA